MQKAVAELQKMNSATVNEESKDDDEDKLNNKFKAIQDMKKKK